MRTTITSDDDVLAAVRAIARRKSQTMGTVISGTAQFGYGPGCRSD